MCIRDSFPASSGIAHPGINARMRRGLRCRVDQAEDRRPFKCECDVVLRLKYLERVVEVHDPWNARHEAAVERIRFRSIRKILALLCFRSRFVRNLPPFNKGLNVCCGFTVRLPDSLEVGLSIGETRQRYRGRPALCREERHSAYC